MANTLDRIEWWHQRARPAPTAQTLGIQIGCHAEEFCEMLESLEPTEAVLKAWDALDHLAALWKSGKHFPVIKDREAFLDSLADQVVTAVGVGYGANMNIVEACARVDASNWTKFDAKGQPTFTEQGKIAKPDTYAPPNLDGLY